MTSPTDNLAATQPLASKAQPHAKKRWWNLLPQDTRYRDTGCDLFPSCLNCPLPRCVEEEPRGRERRRMQAKVHIARAMSTQGLSNHELAALLNVSVRTVSRYINSYKPGGTNGTRTQNKNRTALPHQRPARLDERTRRTAPGRRSATESRQPTPGHPRRHTIRLLRRPVGRRPARRRLAPDPICFPKKTPVPEPQRIYGRP